MMPQQGAKTAEWLEMSSHPSDARVLKIADVKRAEADRLQIRVQRQQHSCSRARQGARRSCCLWHAGR